MVNIGVILVVDDENSELIFGNNLILTRQHIHCGISN